VPDQVYLRKIAPIMIICAIKGKERVEIEWIQCVDYATAKNYSHVVYLHEWDDKPFYWGRLITAFWRPQEKI
jgi:hypothetical protein